MSTFIIAQVLENVNYVKLIDIFQYSVHAHVQNTLKNTNNAEKQNKIFERFCHKSYKIFERIHIRHNLASHEYY